MVKNKNMHVATANDCWVDVKTKQGMFSRELAIELSLVGGKIVTFFADKILIRGEEKGKPQLRVHLVSKKKGAYLILLPSETYETSTRWVEVPSIS